MRIVGMETGLVLAGAVGACAPSPPAALPPPPPSAEMRVDYACDNGEQVTVRYFPQEGVAVLVRGGQNQELQQQATPPGFTYSGGQTALRVSENRLTMQMNIGMMATASCTAR
ncbi:MAG: MliC family protein [Sphingomonadaceae bacterium]